MTVANQTDFIDQIESLPPLPAIVNRILSVTESPNSSAADVARVLSEDQVITAKILRVANSSFYGTGRQITQVSRAVAMLGMVAIRNFVLGISARQAFVSATAQASEHATLWRHSIAVASASEMIARHVGFKPPEEAFIAGLLHDIGQLAMVTFKPESFRATFRDQGHGVGFLALEREHFGIDHAEAGFQILSRWRLPEGICQIALRHHEQEIDADKPSARLLAITMLADTIAQVMGFGFDMPVGKLKRTEISAHLLGLQDSEQMHIVSGLNDRIHQAIEMFASVDAAEDDQESSESKRAIWVSSENPRSCICQLLLEHRGYAVLQVSPDGLGEELSPDDLVIFLSKENASAELAAELIRQGHNKVVLLFDPAEGGALRQQNKETDMYYLPRLFTAFDIQWLEEQFEK